MSNYNTAATFIVHECQIVASMNYHEARAGKRDGISICPEVSTLADVLGMMWYDKVVQAQVTPGSKVCVLLEQAGQRDWNTDHDAVDAKDTNLSESPHS